MITSTTSRLTFAHPVVWIGLLTTISMFGALQRPPLAPVNFTYLTFGAVLFVFVIHMLRKRNRVKMVWMRADSLVAVILVTSLFSTVLANYFYDLPLNLVDGGFTTFIGMLVLYFFTRLSLRRPAHVYFLLSLLMFGFLIYSLLGIGLFVFHPQQANPMLFGAELKVIETRSFTEGMRLTGPTANPNMFVSVPLLALPVATAMFMCSTGLRRKVWYMTIIVSSAAAIFLSFSRSSWIGTLVALLVLGRLMFMKRGNGALRICAVLVILGLLCLPFASSIGGLQSQFFARLDSVNDYGSLGSRPEMWLHALSILAQFPTGVGLGNYREASPLAYSPYSWVSDRSSHNSLVTLSVEGSLIVGLAMAWLMWGQIRGVVRLPKQGKPFFKPIRSPKNVKGDFRREAFLIGLSAAFVAIWIHSTAHSVHAQIAIWVMAACHSSLRHLDG